jgi:hypothetical protein
MPIHIPPPHCTATLQRFDHSTNCPVLAGAPAEPAQKEGFGLSREIRPEENYGFLGLAISAIVSRNGRK